MIGIIILLVLYILIDKHLSKPINIENPYTHLPDTVYVESDYKTEVQKLKEAIDKLSNTPPKVIYHYEKPYDSITVIEKIPDSLLLYIGELQERIAISDQYIKNFPKNSKLVDFKLHMEDLNIGLLDIEGNLTKSQYSLFLTHYEYYWEDNQLKHRLRDKPYKFKANDRWKQLFINAGYDYTSREFKTGIDYNLYFLDRFRVRTNFDVTIESNPEFYGTIDLGFRLLK